MDKLDLAALWDAYRDLLTDTQKEICDMYFNLDLTVSEIADEKDVSRQAVSECVNACKKELASLEETLGFVKRLSESDKEKADLVAALRASEEKYGDGLPGAFRAELEGILDRYSDKD
ncbi:MAG: DNA-binding protein [Clostridia bacterium]|nr:DNA-binding protein [Clostridia bacterium]